MGNERRPEHTGPPEIFYSSTEAKKYTHNSRIIDIQNKLTRRALELICVNPDSPAQLLLDIGCGSGLSGEVRRAFPDLVG